MPCSGVSSIMSGSVQRLFQDSHLQRNEGSLTTQCSVRAPTCCNWIRCLPSVIVWLFSLFHPLPLFLGCLRYVLLACNQGKPFLAPLLKWACILRVNCCFMCSLKKFFWKAQRLWSLCVLQTHPSYFSLRFLLPTVAHWPEGWNPWIVIIPRNHRSNSRWKDVDLGAPGTGL